MILILTVVLNYVHLLLLGARKCIQVIIINTMLINIKSIILIKKQLFILCFLVAVKGLPNFVADPNKGSDPMPHHQTTIHLNCENMSIIHEGYEDAVKGEISRRC